MTYSVRWTPCYPNAWKVHPRGLEGKNHHRFFFPTRKEAEAEAKRLTNLSK